MYDGVILVFEPVNLNGQTLEKFVDTRIQESTADGTSEITQALVISYLNADPGKLGFQQEIDATLSTIQLLK